MSEVKISDLVKRVIWMAEVPLRRRERNKNDKRARILAEAGRLFAKDGYECNRQGGRCLARHALSLRALQARTHAHGR